MEAIKTPGHHRFAYEYAAHTDHSELDLASGSPTEGAVDELHISSLARYTSVFTPLEGPLSCDGSTRALWHLDEFEGMAVFRGVYDTTDNTLVGYNRVHGEGVLAHQVYLLLVVGQD